MHYVISDIHNNCEKLSSLLKKIRAVDEDYYLYIVGDLFDRTEYAPDPTGVYFIILRLGDRCTVIRGNHEQLLATHIMHYCNIPERKRKKLSPYEYNSFELLKNRLTLMDLKNLAEWIMEMPLQANIQVEGVEYLLAHAKTSHPNEPREDDYYMNGEMDDKKYMEVGIEGYISICGHHELQRSIWKNAKENVYVVDCGCGYRDGRLGCLCLETKEEFYV